MAQPEVLLEVEMNEMQTCPSISSPSNLPTGKKSFFCTLCSYSSDYSNNVKNHSMKVHKKSISDFECCDIKFSDKIAMKKHLIEFHVKRFHCEICNFGFFNPSHLGRHAVRCKSITSKQETLQKQNLTVRKMKVSKDAKPSLHQHKKSSSLTFPLKPTSFKCTKCPFQTKWPNCLRRHIQSLHDVIYNCCGSRFTSKKSLKEHKLAEHGTRFKCSVCAQIFSSVLLFKNHQITHSGHKNFKCNLCDYSSLWKSNLKKHVSLKHEANYSSLAGQLDKDNRSPTYVDLSDGCGAPSDEKKVAVGASSDDSSVKESNNGKENLDAGEICDVSNSGISADFTRNLVEQQLKLRRKGIVKEKKDATKSPTRSSKRHKSEDYHNNSSSQMAEILSTSTAPNFVLKLDSDEEVSQSSSETSQVVNKSEPIQADFKGKKTKLLETTTIYKCTLCPLETKRPDYLKVHIKTMHTPQGIDSSPMNSSLNSSIISKLSPSISATVLTCLLCPYSTKWPSNLGTHMKRKHGENNLARRFQCAICSQEFDSPFILRRHHEAVHSLPTDSGVFKCSICEFTTSTKDFLMQHDTETHFYTSPLERWNLENPAGQSSSQQQTAVDKTEVSLPLKQIKNKIGFKETNCTDRSTSESDQSFSSPQPVRLPTNSLRRSGRLATEKAPPSMNDSYCQPLSQGSTLVMNSMSIHVEARQIRAQIPLAMTIPAVLSLLQRLLEMSCSLTNLMREEMEVESRSQTIESFEYVWNTSKVAVVRWEDLKGLMNHDTSLNAVKYAYGTLPLFNDWEKSDHLEILENVILLIVNTVKNSELQPSNRSDLRFSESFQITSANAKFRSSLPCLPTDQSKKRNAASVAVGMTTKANVSAVNLSKNKTFLSLKEFCRLANISIWQNTKCRSRKGFKDDFGDYHTMYRVGIGKMLNLYCPGGVTHLKCCGMVFDLSELKDHVDKNHEAGRPNRTEPSISPA